MNERKITIALASVLMFVCLQQLIDLFIDEVASRVSERVNPWTTFENERAIHEMKKESAG